MCEPETSCNLRWGDGFIVDLLCYCVRNTQNTTTQKPARWNAIMPKVPEKNCRSKINMLELSPKRKELTIHTVEQSWTWQSHISPDVYHLLTCAVLSVLICLIHYVSISSHTPCRSKDCWVNQLLCKTGLLYIPGLYVCCDVCALTLKVLTVPMQTKLHLWILRSSYLC